MSRLNYSEDEDFPGQFHLYQANCRRSLASRKGQAVLRDMEAALLALPDKRLVHRVVAAAGDVCAVGAYVLQQRLAAGDDRAGVLRDLEEYNEYDDTPELGERHGMPHLVAWKLVEMNDIHLDTKWDAARRWEVRLTPEERYDRMLDWVRDQIKQEQP